MTDQQRRALIDALCEVPQFESESVRRAFVRAVFEGREYSADLKKALTWLNWNENVQTVADGFVRHIEGREIEPGVLAVTVLIKAIEPLAGELHRQFGLAGVTPAAQPVPPLPAGSGFDVFLCHNSKDKPEVKIVAQMLMARGLRPWLDEWELQPGIPWQPEIEKLFPTIRSAAVFLGRAGTGAWQEEEVQAILSRFKREGRPVIPVFLETAPVGAEFSAFLDSRTRVDFRKNDPDPLEQLIFGITGAHPQRAWAAKPTP